LSAVALRYSTDPGCPTAFAAEPQRLRLLWLYGDQIAWEQHMVVLEGGASIHACRAVVATRLRWPDREAALLRRLRVLTMAGEPIDMSDTLELAAEEAGLPVAELAAYCAEPEVEEALRADLADPRPSPSYEIRRIDEPARVVDLRGPHSVEAIEAALVGLAPELERREG
jgi:predicted DsbA family dithiol-disulfide isomerase